MIFSKYYKKRVVCLRVTKTLPLFLPNKKLKGLFDYIFVGKGKIGDALKHVLDWAKILKTKQGLITFTWKLNQSAA